MCMKKDKYIKRMGIIMFAMCIISLVLQINLVPAHASGDVKKVLVLQSYHRGHEWSDREGNAIIKTMADSDMKVDTSIEYMDWKRYPHEENLKQLYSRFQYKYANQKIDLIMTTDDAALKFALEHRAALFSDAPIVFSGVFKKDANLLLNGQTKVTGVYQVMDPEGTIYAAKIMIPDLKNVYIIHDRSESGISTGNLIKNAVQEGHSELMLWDLSDSSLDQILKTVKTLDNDSIVFLASYNSDINHVLLSVQDFAGRISEKSAVPVFTVDETILGAGSIGGSLTSGTVHGKMAAEVGLRILKGADVNQIAVADTKSVFWGFDYQELSRFNIPLNVLPDNSKIINKPFSFFETYKTFVLSNLAIISVLIFLVVLQSFNLKYRVKIENTLKKQKEEIYKLAYFSPVTGLRNRIHLKERMEAMIQGDMERADFFALIYIDLDNFKEVNDTFGHTVGDHLLRSFAQRIKEIEGINDNAYSLGGDEFIVLIRDSDEKRIEVLVKKLFQDISKPFLIDSNTFYITVSGGIVFYPDHGKNYIELLKNADTAMYRSKELGKGIFTYFDQSISDDAVEKTNMQSNLRLAMERGDFLLYYQPQINTKTGEIWGFEALIRWSNPELGLIQPLSFIKIAEESRLIIPIGEWILETACCFLKKSQDEFQKKSIISVNISVIQLVQDDFVENVLKILEKSGLSPSCLELEITETIFLKSSNYIIEKLEKLKGKGIRIALDDFGTGYSSLSYLSQLPISTLKIDKTFIQNYFASDKNMVLTTAIVKMGHALGLELVAEGVETEEQQELFTKMGCDRIQGYHISEPVPEQEILQFLREGKQKN